MVLWWNKKTQLSRAQWDRLQNTDRHCIYRYGRLLPSTLPSKHARTFHQMHGKQFLSPNSTRKAETKWNETTMPSTHVYKMQRYSLDEVYIFRTFQSTFGRVYFHFTDSYLCRTIHTHSLKKCAFFPSSSIYFKQDISHLPLLLRNAIFVLMFWILLLLSL